MPDPSIAQTPISVAPPDSEPPPGLPPFQAVLKSRDVEDPVNLWLHRPLAYGFVALIFRTSITPNQVTGLATLLGLAAAAAWIEGSPRAMVAGGALLWASAIMDGADGILARAKRMSSEFGRALDGFADMAVGFSMVVGAMYHLYATGQLGPTSTVVWAVVATACTVFQLNFYDVYKELFLRSTRVGTEVRANAESRTSKEVAETTKSELVREAAWYTRLSMNFYADYLLRQERMTQRSNPQAAELMLQSWSVTEESAAVYRKHNSGTMSWWISISLCPHSYLFAIAGMLDMLLPYLIARITLANVVAVGALLSQRRASGRTLAAFREAGWLQAP